MYLYTDVLLKKRAAAWFFSFSLFFSGVFLPCSFLYRTAGLPDDVCSLLLFSLESIVWCIQEVSDVGSMSFPSIDSLSEFPVLRESQEQRRDTSTVLSSSISEKLPRGSGLDPDASRFLESGRRGEEEDAEDESRKIRKRGGEDDGEKDEEEERRRKGREQVLLTLFGISKQTLAGAFGACGLLLDEMSPKDRRRSKIETPLRGGGLLCFLAYVCVDTCVCFLSLCISHLISTW